MPIRSNVRFWGYLHILMLGVVSASCGDNSQAPVDTSAGSNPYTNTDGNGTSSADNATAAAGVSDIAVFAENEPNAGHIATAGTYSVQDTAGTPIAADKAGISDSGNPGVTGGTGETAGASGGGQNTVEETEPVDDASTSCGSFDTGLYFCDSRDAQLYKWVQIGTQVWMAENLNYGTEIEGSLDQTEIGKKYCYKDTASNCDVYGGLYQWATAMGLNSSCNDTICSTQIQSEQRGICPEGWHIPTDSEWSTLKQFVDTNNGDDDVAYSLKATSDWATNPETGIGGPGNDAFRFTALAGGGRYSLGYRCAGRELTDSYFCWGGKFRGMFWSGGEDSESSGCIQDISDDQTSVTRMCGQLKVYGFSVRCIKD